MRHADADDDDGGVGFEDVVLVFDLVKIYDSFVLVAVAVAAADDVLKVDKVVMFAVAVAVTVVFAADVDCVVFVLLTVFDDSVLCRHLCVK